MNDTTTNATRPCDTRTLRAQIGRMNVLAISGGRSTAHTATDSDGTFVDGVVLPVRYGYAVVVTLAANDTYTVQRTFTRSGVTTVKAERADVYCDQVGDVAYELSCWN